MLSRKLITLCLVLAFVVPYFAVPKTARAVTGCATSATGLSASLSSSTSSGKEVPVISSTANRLKSVDNSKELCADGILNTAMKIVIKSLTSSIINWINSGFEGDPTFVGNPGAFFADIANETSGAFIRDLGLAGLCDPFRPQILIALAQAREQPRFACTLLDVIDNFENFQNDFSQGGWPAWIQMTQYPQNNPYGLYAITLDTQNRLINNALGLKKDEIGQGSGFLSLRKCDQFEEGHYATYDENTGNDGGGYIATANEGGIVGCEKASVTTPGNVIAEQLNQSLGSPLRQLELADEFNESVSAIFNALISKLISDGVRSLTDKSTGKSGWDDSAGEVTSLIVALEKGAKNLDLIISARDRSILLIADISKQIDVLVTECDAYLKSKYPPGDPLYPGTLRSRQSGLGATTAQYSKDINDAGDVLFEVTALLSDARLLEENQKNGTATTQEFSELLTKYQTLAPNIPDEATALNVENDMYQYETNLAELNTAYAECKGQTTATTTAARISSARFAFK